MANEELFEDEFYQEDFSSASIFEAFVSRISELFEEYIFDDNNKEPLQKNQLFLCDWTEESDDVSFNDFEFVIKRYQAKISDPTIKTKDSNNTNFVFEDLSSMENNYCLLDEISNMKLNREKSWNDRKFVHPIAVWYGLRDFVVIRSKRIIIDDVSHIKLFQSAMNLAVVDSKCKIPVFLQIMHPDQNVFLGLYDNSEQRVSFDIIHLKTPPPSCRYLSGLLDMFKGKIDTSFINPSLVSVRLAYSLKNFTSVAYSTEKFNDNDEWDVIDFLTGVSSLPFGVSADPVCELIFYAHWPQVVENVVFDSQTYSDFNPINAPKWSMRFRYDDTPVTFLADTLHEFLTLSESPEALSEYYSFLTAKNRMNEAERNPFQSLTESKIPSLGGMFDYQSYTIEGPINDHQMKNIIEFVLPANEDDKFQYHQQIVESSTQNKMKSAAPDSLLHRLSIILANIYTIFGGRRGVAQFWAEFSQEIRRRFEKSEKIPGIEKGFPDMRTCLLHQKLQMLNICIERKNLREGRLINETILHSIEDRNDSEDEFFDCDEDEQFNDDYTNDSPWSPVGRMKRLGNALLIDCNEPLYIPVTQDPVPKTEDELEDDAEMLLNVVDGELRAQLMSASLFSDMESFKAANPKAKLEDFIRWYSPRDWIQDNESEDASDRNGRLSDRMQIPGNTWMNVWSSAKAVPARRQKRLFDDTKEAEKVLHFLESQTLGGIGQLAIPCLFHSALIKLENEYADLKKLIPNFDTFDSKLRQNCCILSREKWNSSSKTSSKKKWETVVNEISEMELNINQIRSMMKKLGLEITDIKHEVEELLISLMKCHVGELNEVMKSTIGSQILALFQSSYSDQSEHNSDNESINFPNTLEKQFVLRLSGKTTNNGLGGPQFLRAILSPYDFRLCGAFSRNVSFSFEI